MYGKDDFEAMIEDWRANGGPEYDDLEVDEPELVNDKWVVSAHDGKSSYELSDDGSGNIVINYVGTR